MSQPAQSQEPPGSTAEMRPRPDHGEESYRGTGRLAGKKAVITGADSGIGRAVAIAYAREGADVLLSYLNEDEDAEDTARLVREAGQQAVLVPGDIATAQQCRDIIDRAVAEFGQIDVLVSNAAYQMSHESLHEISDEECRCPPTLNPPHHRARILALLRAAHGQCHELVALPSRQRSQLEVSQQGAILVDRIEPPPAGMQQSAPVMLQVGEEGGGEPARGSGQPRRGMP
jgi:NAD(P)-dependent dehydrogenase (short-subunit alcohol dehydrogenase family)